MGRNQQQLYDSIISAHAQRGNSTASTAKNVFTDLKKAANHPLLLRSIYTEEKLKKIIDVCTVRKDLFEDVGTDPNKIGNTIASYSDHQLHNICLHYKDILGDLILKREVLYSSPKICWLEKNLPVMIEQGHRILIFSQWKIILNIVEILLGDLNIKFFRMDGELPPAVRQNMVDRFSRPVPGDERHVFLLTTTTGGLGLNLTAADTVILHDLDFNPEKDRQAEDRAYRIGQTRDVTVYRLIVKGTVDEDIFKMAGRKSELTEAVLSDGNKNEGKSGEGSTIRRILQNAIQRYQERDINDDNNHNNGQQAT